jgi:hypothetical protein
VAVSKLKKVKKLEPIFSYRVNSVVKKGYIDVYAFDTDYNCYFVVTFTEDDLYDEKIYACVRFKRAKELVDYAYRNYMLTTAYQPNPFKLLLDDKYAKLRLQQIIDDVVEEEWWRERHTPTYPQKKR